jgi:hypothetical protein
MYWFLSPRSGAIRVKPRVTEWEPVESVKGDLEPMEWVTDRMMDAHLQGHGALIFDSNGPHLSPISWALKSCYLTFHGFPLVTRGFTLDAPLRGLKNSDARIRGLKEQVCEWFAHPSEIVSKQMNYSCLSPSYDGLSNSRAAPDEGFRAHRSMS